MSMNVGMNSTLRAAKRVLRKDLAARLNNMTKEEIREQSRSVQQQVISSEWYKRSKTIAVYLAMEQELQTDLLIGDLLNGIQILLSYPLILSFPVIISSPIGSSISRVPPLTSCIID
jgi:5-formyltetrahydrofolate cyclo-ligase